MRRLLLILALLLVSLSVASAAWAEDDPNACLTGGSLEGKCDLPTDAQDAWAWTCGYYVGLYDNKEISRDQIPDWCYYPEPGLLVSNNCLKYLMFDVALIGPINTYENFGFYASTDGTCSGGVVNTETVVQTATEPEAMTLCQTLLGTPYIYLVPLEETFGAPGYWGCGYSTPV